KRQEVLFEALDIAREIVDERYRAEALAALAPHLPEKKRQEVLREALEVARAIENEGNRAEALSALTPHLPEALLSEALDVAREIEEEMLRAWALAALAPRLHEWARHRGEEAWREACTTLRRLALYPRPEFLQDLKTLLPFFLELVPEGERKDAAGHIFHAAWDVTQWWP
ncbi:MAG: hypothetical protein D6765_13835, partial [Bacteroidetes bacterium]